MSKSDPLPERYRKSLALIEEGNLTYIQIAKACKIPVELFYDLIEGNAKNYGTIQEKFTEEFEAIQKRLDRNIRKYSKSCREQTFALIDSFLKKHKDVGKKDKSLISSLTTIANSLGRLTPNVEIGSFSYTKGLSAEDIYAEFKRLSGLASDRGTVQDTTAAGTREIPLSPGSRGTTSEESEDTSL
jgi:hypothetical protein